MKKILASVLLAIPFLAHSQAAVDVYSLSQNDLKGTARYMSMAGAYGALGGDLSAINQNPGGIGVYRSADLGITLNLDFQSTQSGANGLLTKMSQTKFDFNNFGYVGVGKLDSDILPYLNFGFSYNRPISFNRRYSGKITNIKNSLSNYIADVTNKGGYTEYDLCYFDDSDPYYNSSAPWLSIMAYNSYIMNPVSTDGQGYGFDFVGLMNAASKGFSEYEVIERGGVDEFNMNIGGNISDILYWGLGVGVGYLDYDKYTYYGEAISDATVVANEEGKLDNKGEASYGLENWLTTNGTGLNIKFGVIVKPINEFRFGVAIHSPTYWTLTDRIYSAMNYETVSSSNYVLSGTEEANVGYVDEINYEISTPWKFNLSAAAVLGGKAIVSAEYERLAYNDMSVKYDYGYGAYTEDPEVSKSIKDYYKAMNIYKIGAEYRLTPQVSLRLGYAYHSSPVNEDAMNDRVNVITAGTTPAYTFDKATQYITGGVGYRYKAFYTDLAYVHKSKESEYKAFSPANGGSPTAIVKDSNNQLVWSIGYRF